MAEPALHVARQESRIRNRAGMHARAAVKFVQLAAHFKSEIHVVKDDTSVNGKSIMGLLTLVVTTLVTALSVAREREQGTFDQLLVTPFRPGEILVGKALPGSAGADDH